MATHIVGDGSPDGVSLQATTTELLSFYGVTPIAQRSGAAQDTTNLSTASSTAIDTLTKAAIIEIMNTLRLLGLWKGSA